MNIRICASMPVKVREQLLAISSLLLPLLIEAGFLLLFLLCCSVYSRLTGLLASGKFSCLCCLSPHISAGIADVLHHLALFFFLSSLRVLYKCFAHIYLPSPNSSQIHCCFLPTQLCVHLKKTSSRPRLNILGCVVFQLTMVDLPRATLVDKMVSPFPSCSQLPDGL